MNFNKEKVRSAGWNEGAAFGLSLHILAVMLMAGMDVLAKWVGETVYVGELYFYRSLFGVLPVLVLYWIESPENRIISTSTSLVRLQIVRGLCTAALIATFFGALQGMKLADAVGISLIGPILLIPIGAFLLKENTSQRRWHLVLVSAIGVLLIVRPEISKITFHEILAFLSAIFFALTVYLTKTLTGRTSYYDVSVWTTLTGLVIGVLWMTILEWPHPNREELLILLVMGVMGGASNILFLAAYRKSEVSYLAPFDYLVYVWALVFGFAMFNEIPDSLAIAGASITIIAGLYAALKPEAESIKGKK